MSAFRDLIGHPPFGRLTVVERGPNKGHRVQWWCDCTCGTRCLVVSDQLCSGKTRSCGCLHRELARQRRFIHGMTHSPEYVIWNNMRRRCLDPRDKAYARYGGRGITVCDRWHSFQSFYADVGPRPSPHHSLERRDNAGHYMPSNVCWATRTVQGRNTRANRMLTLHGETRCIAEWAERFDIKVKTLYARISKGWSDEDALTIGLRHGVGWRLHPLPFTAESCETDEPSKTCQP